jgi:formamidopyrimidine-DNA glycosylase
VPELPEVETTRRGVAPHVEGRRISRVIVRDPRLRWPVPASLPKSLAGARVETAERRAKYLLFRTDRGTLILHLGMSGSLRIVSAGAPPEPHDHVDLVLDSGQALRLRDPRRFGSLHFTKSDPLQHPLLRNLGPEPLSADFDGERLWELSRGRRAPVKTFIMDSHVVVGVGNIYANEALFIAGIHPKRPAGRISRERYDALATAIKRVLTEAIAEGGTTLRDFVREDGQPGYFPIKVRVYEREGGECLRCGGEIRRRVIGQRASYFCAQCQR